MFRFYLPKEEWESEQAALDDNVLQHIIGYLPLQSLGLFAQTCSGINRLCNDTLESKNTATLIRYIRNNVTALIALEEKARATDYQFFPLHLCNYFKLLQRSVACLPNACPKLTHPELTIRLVNLFIGYLIYAMAAFDHATQFNNLNCSRVYTSWSMQEWHAHYRYRTWWSNSIDIADLMLFMGEHALSDRTNRFMNRDILTRELDLFLCPTPLFPHFADKVNVIEKIMTAARELMDGLLVRASSAPTISHTSG